MTSGWTMEALLRRVCETAERQGLRCKGDVYIAVNLAIQQLGGTVELDGRVTLPKVPVVVHLYEGRELGERIVRAAIRDGEAVYSVAIPGRHSDVCMGMIKAGVPSEAMTVENQGFLTSTGRWVDRAEAAEIARAAGQLFREVGPRDMLTSENVW